MRSLPGAQFTQTIAARYCMSQGMRLPTVADAQTVASNHYAGCAFPNPWTTWTATGVAGDSTRAYFMSSAGVQSSQIIDNSPGLGAVRQRHAAGVAAVAAPALHAGAIARSGQWVCRCPPRRMDA